ncbi:hypothetical protein FOXG_17248 [Fusarium oxysporum f. sp. lycopersici 4287]|uniref:Uncharacterized protein n=1 Tax=Fusarium oxysporum f. sp. lycopersici (strain 4287 / CBS 123668 / FGSC 9935 / NRRL 34936) TaxID=426428 RepID=A0A0J9WBS5_FUSO4|nr:hypothetical protein FOXG_17248 [Fusarium oxysporum f. sp. lycopersici 4287]XP_018258030.1 hypothetical protein FOXG_17248 [Fusarium oxysporum f. sp. lycopersici 4287]KNB19984.1 hypothetical protein FOXG_17248 [Fusarium oxysporum f. sp. lycopersici 4287]KNB19985.1 hypothetical protein FOXG_17248 [Fusarium oxysporum f. sp. lycopersici 4287]
MGLSHSSALDLLVASLTLVCQHELRGMAGVFSKPIALIAHARQYPRFSQHSKVPRLIFSHLIFCSRRSKTPRRDHRLLIAINMDTKLLIPTADRDSGFYGEPDEFMCFEIDERSSLVDGQRDNEALDNNVVKPEAAREVPPKATMFQSCASYISPAESRGEVAVDTRTVSVNSTETDHCEFWKKQRLTNSVSQDLLMAAKSVLLRGPDPDLLGVRAYPDFTNKDDIPDTTLCIAEQNEMGQLIYKELSLPVEPSDCEKSSEIWPLVEQSIEGGWPEEMPATKQDWSETTDLDSPKSSDVSDILEGPMAEDSDRAKLAYMATLRRHPGHFVGDWSFFNDALVTLAELSFTPLGFPSVEFGKDRAGLFPNLRRGRPDIFGRSWTIRPNGRIMPWRIFAFALSQVTLGHDLHMEEVAECATVFLKRYVCTWPTTPWTNWCCTGNTMFHAQFHIRYWSIEENTITRSNAKPTCTGLRFNRDYGRTVGFASIPEFPIIETRSAVAMITSLWQKHPPYTMVTLTDTAVFNPDCIAEQKLWAAIGLEMCDESGGIAIFQAAVGGLITEWGHQWAAVLGQITATSKYEVRDILDVTKRGLNSSKVEPKTWYALRQLLLKSQDTIKELSRDLHSHANDLDRSISVITNNPTLSANWKALFAYHEKIEDNLLRRIQKKLADLDMFAQACALGGP